jgi:hypothetical protein
LHGCLGCLPGHPVSDDPALEHLLGTGDPAGYHVHCIETYPADATCSWSKASDAAQFTMGKSIAFLRANFRKALLVPSGGSGMRISVTISPGSRTVVPFSLTLKNCSAFMVRLDVTTDAPSAMSAGAVSLGWTATHPFSTLPPKMEWNRLSPLRA